MISANFSLEELTFSETAVRMGLDNTCPEEYISNMETVAEALEKVRQHFGEPINILSCYRSPKVNKACGGSETSAHRFALAADFRVKNVINIDVCKYIESRKDIDYDQVIYEFGSTGWIHLGFSKTPRRQSLSAVKKNAKTVYLQGIV